LQDWNEEIKMEIPEFDLSIDFNFDKNPIKKVNTNYYKSIYYFIECKDIEEFDKIKNDLESIKNKGVLIEQSAN
jgi:hypothetical protein